MDKETKERYLKNLEWAKAYWARKTQEFKIVGWSFGVNHAKTSLAMTNYTDKKVVVSSYLLRGHSLTKIRNAILHEIAHIFAGHKNGHNAKWKAIALKIGCDGEICGTMSQVPANYLMFCPKGCFKIEYYRRPKLDNKLCAKCKSSLKLTAYK